MANTHPFCQDARLFAHNGVIGDVPTARGGISATTCSLVIGESDSERYFALITGEIDRHDGDVGAGIRAAVQWIVANLPIVSINFVLITATDLWALRYPETDTLFVLERPAGGSSGDPVRLDQSSRHGTRVTSEHARDRPVVVVASERLDQDTGGARSVRGNCCTLARASTFRRKSSLRARLRIRCSGALPSVLITARRSHVVDHRQIAAREALDELSRACAQVDDRAFGRDRHEPPVGAELHPAFEAIDRQLIGGHRLSLCAAAAAAAAAPIRP